MGAYVLAQPQLIATVADDVAALGTTINEATTAAAARTTGLAAAAADEVSDAVATLFNTYAHECQAVIGQAVTFHSDFVQALTASGNAYANAETTSVGALTAPSFLSPMLANTVTLVMDGSGTPIPPADFITNVVSKYVLPHFPAGLVRGLALPAGEYPDSGVKDLLQSVSISRGVQILNSEIQQQLAAGNIVNVVGYSQGANIASLEMQLLDPTGTPSNLPINFVLLGNSMTPNGGWDARFPGLSLPTLGFSTLGAAPSNSFPTFSYALEYDGWADFPRYPVNIVSDLNALAGMVTVHTGYASLTPAEIASAIQLPTQGPNMTTYYMIPTENLPLLDPVRAIPFVGAPTADFLNPILKPIVNWGYGDPNYGWSTGPANVPTPFGFLPPLSDTAALGPALVGGLQQGISAAASDLLAVGPPTSPSFQDISGALASLTSGTGGLALPTGLPSLTDILTGLQSANTQIVGTATTDFSTAYATLLPTADIATALAVSLPSYDVNLFLSGISQMVNGQPIEGLINAFGLPIAANVGLVPLTAGLELTVLGEAVDSILTGAMYPSP
ncbi:PE-PPE domain-containing protein [Mycobacterium sp. 1423905.2]|uniref:PE-PPE domain-containing protein n=1 Tax=Mycobacterium sp. 1423905.2 TaxID=1856859 RepID=UPI0007FFCA50|nr:PE-PPE domain-containing protein [Mycobacterium sp. 1423905.2]OBJ55147.1 hypothetical protein A9W95_15475 [Mycobacterium sp. 1423905.2]